MSEATGKVLYSIFACVCSTCLGWNAKKMLETWWIACVNMWYDVTVFQCLFYQNKVSLFTWSARCRSSCSQWKSGPKLVRHVFRSIFYRLDDFLSGKHRITLCTSKSISLFIMWKTNHSKTFTDILDSALLRPGRIDRKIEFPPPGPEARVAILRIHSRKVHLFTSFIYKYWYLAVDVAATRNQPPSARWEDGPVLWCGSPRYMYRGWDVCASRATTTRYAGRLWVCRCKGSSHTQITIMLFDTDRYL